MEYFEMKEDEREPCPFEILNMGQLKEELGKIGIGIAEEPFIAMVAEREENDYPDYLCKPRNMISDKLKKIFEMYDPDIIYKPVAVIDTKRVTREVYWHIRPYISDCLSEGSLYSTGGFIEKIVINEKKAGNLKIFIVKSKFEDHIIISLDVAESILRRGMRGISITKIEKEESEV